MCVTHDVHRLVVALLLLLNICILWNSTDQDLQCVRQDGSPEPYVLHLQFSMATKPLSSHLS